MIANHRSRIQIHGNAVNKKQNAKTPVLDPKLTAGAQVAAVPIHDKGNSAVHTATPRPLEDAEATFRKERVASSEELENSGKRRSILRAVVAVSHTSSTAVDSDEEVSDSPWASLVLEAPGGCVPASAAAREITRSSVSSTWLQTLVSLFAGRKKQVQVNKTEQHKPTAPVTPPVTTEASGPKTANVLPAEPARPATPPRPVLTHRQVIPSVQRASAEDPARKPGYKEVPPAPHHPFVGYAVLAGDVFEPEVTQRGFKLPGSPKSTLSVPTFEHSRNRSSDSLFNRKGDNWAVFHSKYKTPESNPFSRTNSEADLDRINNRALKAGSGAASTRSSSTSGMSCPLFIW